LALTPEQNDALIREVDDAVRRDDVMSFWSRYGRLVVGLVGAALALYGAWLLWQNHQRGAAEQASEQFAVMIKAAQGVRLDQDNFDKLTKNGTPGYRAEAELVKAALASGKGDLKTAIASYDSLHADSNAPEPIRALALIRKTALTFDTMKPQAVIDTLKDLAVQGNPWFGSAGEMTAIAYLKMNRKREAGDMFASINRDPAVNSSIRLRAGQMATMLGVAPSAITNIEPQGE